jgi:putative membrane protein
LRLPRFGDWYAAAFSFFSLGHVWASFGVLCVLLVSRAGLRWLPAFVMVYVASLASELSGTTFGVPFGGYEYTSLMGPRWLDRVPVAIPVSWFYMAVPAYALVRRFGSEWTWPRRFAVGAFGLVVWDLSLDPAMSFATPYWVWEEAGPYYGMPWVNLAGWFVTGLVLMAVIRASGGEEWTDRLPTSWLSSFFAVNLLLPLGMNLATGLWGAVGLTLVGCGVAWWILGLPAWRGSARRSPEVALARVDR